MRGLVASMDLEMELAESDEVVVSQKPLCLVDSVHLFTVLFQMCHFNTIPLHRN